MPVYFIRATVSGPVKIGTALDVAGRLAELQCGNHEPLAIIRTVEGGRPVERWLHRHFRPLARRGEWFEFAPEMLTIEPPAVVPERADALQRAILAANGVAALAQRLGVSSQAVSQWKRVPAERALDVERATGGAVSCEELRPDIYPPEDAA